MANFTKGPWSIHDNGKYQHGLAWGGYWQIDAEFDAVACNQYCYANADEKTSISNAMLIAASPDLYDVAEMVSRLNPDAGEIGAGMLAKIVDRARKAIAKADGEAK